MRNHRQYICTIIIITAIIALIATWEVLNAASSDSDTESRASALHEIEVAHTVNEKSPINDVNIEASSLTTLNRSTNVIIILLDDAGWGDFSFHTTDPWYALSTPNMDSILKGGLYFSNYYTQAVCSPARASLMTGRWTWVLGVQKMQLYDTCMNAHLSRQFPTWATLVGEKGYKNYMWGKWHLGMDSWLSTPLGRGFHYYRGNFNEATVSGGGAAIEEKGGWYSIHSEDEWGCVTSLADQTVTAATITECLMRSWIYYYVQYNETTGNCYSFLEDNIPAVCSLYEEGTTPSTNDAMLYKEGYYIHLSLREHSIDYWQNNGPADPRVNKRMDMVIFDEVVHSIREQSLTPEEKWTMYIAVKTPHQDGAYLENGTHTNVVPGCSRFFDSGSSFYNYDRGAICQQMFEIDARIGEMIELLKEVGTWDDTLIILTNDNGGTSGQSPQLSYASYNYAINTPLRGVKGSYFEGAVKTILGISGGALPEGLRGTTNSNLHHVSDIAPTVIAAAGYSDEEISTISNGTNFDGVPLLSTTLASYQTHDYIYLSMHSDPTDQAYRSNDTSIILANGMKYIGPEPEYGTYGYWGTLPIWDTIGPKWENCTEGCVWDLTTDPLEETDIGYVSDHEPFIRLLDKAYDSELWNDGETFEMADCSECSCCQSCSNDNTSTEHFGFYYYFPWKDDSSILDVI